MLRTAWPNNGREQVGRTWKDYVREDGLNLPSMRTESFEGLQLILMFKVICFSFILRPLHRSAGELVAGLLFLRRCLLCGRDPFVNKNGDLGATIK